MKLNRLRAYNRDLRYPTRLFQIFNSLLSNSLLSGGYPDEIFFLVFVTGQN